MLEDRLSDEAGRLRALQRYPIRAGAAAAEFETITSLVRSVFGVAICGVTLVEQEEQRFLAASGIEPGCVERRHSVCDVAIRSHAPLIVPDLLADERFSDNPVIRANPRLRSYAGAPLTTPDGYNIGALCVIDDAPRSLNGEQQSLLAGFAKLVVEQCELKTLASQDFLTGVLSRRAFTERAHEWLAGGRRRDDQGTLVTFDIDHFKAVNDRFGHAAGDEVLKAVAGACRTELRPLDLLGRLGGEEFSVFLGGAGPEEGWACAERLRQAISALDFPGRPPVTASFGIATLRASGSLAEALEDADAALYEAKRSGRNRCVSAAGTVRLAS